MEKSGQQEQKFIKKNRNKSSSKYSQALNVRCFMATDQVKKGDLFNKCCPTDEMVEDYMTMLLQQIKSAEFQNTIVGHE